MFIKLAPGDIDEVIPKVQAVWTKIMPEQPLEYTFQDEQLNLLHRREMKFESLVHNQVVKFNSVYKACSRSCKSDNMLC